MSTRDNKVPNIIENIKQELLCPICGDLPLMPVRLKIVNTDDAIVSRNVPSWTICNDIYCKACIINFLYHKQKGIETHIHDSKCPVCARYVYVSQGSNDFFNCFIEDKVSKKIIDYIVFEINKDQQQEWNCIFKCGYTTYGYDGYKKMINHTYEKCSNKIIKCSLLACTFLGTNTEMDTHILTCPCKFVRCPICFQDVENESLVFYQHLQQHTNPDDISHLTTLP